MSDAPSSPSSLISRLLAFLVSLRTSLAAFRASNQKDHDAIRHKCCNNLDDP
jgi:hypothetical protein